MCQTRQERKTFTSQLQSGYRKQAAQNQPVDERQDPDALLMGKLSNKEPWARESWLMCTYLTALCSFWELTESLTHLKSHRALLRRAGGRVLRGTM